MRSEVATGRRMKGSEMVMVATRRSRFGRGDLRARAELALPLDDDLLAGGDARDDGEIAGGHGDLDRLRGGGAVGARDVDEAPLRPALQRRARHDQRTLPGVD